LAISRTFESKTAPGEIKGVMNITVRDTERDTAVITLWGKEADLIRLDAEVEVGTIVDVTEPKVKLSRPQNQIYVPEVSCPFTLEILMDAQGVITVNNSAGYASEPLHRLLKLPTKPMASFLSLNDANQCGLRSMNDCDQSVDLLVAIRAIRPVRNIFLTKTQTTKQYREVVVMDRSFGGISIKFWGAANIRRSDRWRRGTVLLLENIRVSFCKFSKSSFLTVIGRTVILEDPLIQEADELRQLSLSVPVGEMDIRSSVSDAVTDGE
jgi:meiosis-specific with OB domain-containing protein